MGHEVPRHKSGWGGRARGYQTGAHIFAGPVPVGVRGQVPRAAAWGEVGHFLGSPSVSPLVGTYSWARFSSFIPVHFGALGCRPPASKEEGTRLGVGGKSQDSPPETLLSGKTGAEAGRRGQGSGDK